MLDRELGPTRLFHVESIRVDDRVVLSLEGELDIAGIEELTTHVEQAYASPSPHVLIDLRALTFIDGTGVRAIVGAVLLLGDRTVIHAGPPRVHRVFELTGAARALPFIDPPTPHPIENERQSNLDFVRRLWHAFSTGGADAMARLVPEDVEWRPSVAGGRVLRGREELRRFWAGRPVGAAVRVTEFRALGDAVLVRCEYPRMNGTLKVVWSLYHFSEMLLRRAETYETESEALAHAA
jgi:anti-sigma B factor antagonist